MQTTSHILMIRPVRFAFNEQTAESNAFQNPESPKAAATVQEKALLEFDRMVEGLRNFGIDVTVVEDTPEPHTPDAIFPNNWVSFHQDGSVCLYPMFAANRRLERREEIIESLKRKFRVERTLDFSTYERNNLFLEGTGSMVLDRVNKIAYACLSPRTSIEVLQDFAQKLGYRLVSFTATDEKGKQIYHTNVLMSIADRFAVVCLDTIADANERELVLQSLQESGKEIVEISIDQMKRFAGNMLQLKNKQGEAVLVMSTQAYRSLMPGQLKILEKYNHMFYSDLSTIESNGGGSARCMIAEVHLPAK
ncbi:arginine deiminase-related protein [Rhodocytophaga aerolata]|uniref:Arginine deiminase-related protein n=1 Tax=Rhodocytophaga aerolata TaxID=455078 RepID=A0ABT8R7L2_9BACT|nr:arginine deiminase-related protein [Rhodocytophaga aerolata]MDO1447178.1 arginine deiminase-related protein [Rhodocytophaga aerolata]